MGRKHRNARKKKKDFFLRKEKNTQFYTGIIEIKKSGNAWVVANEIEKDIFIPRIFTKTAISGDEVKVSLIKSPKIHGVEGKVEEVLKRNTLVYVGEVVNQHNRYFVKCDNELRIKLKNKKNAKFKNVEHGKIVVVNITEFKEPFKGQVIEILGDKNDPHVSLLRIARKYGYQKDFSPEAISELASFDQAYIDFKANQRTDLRNEKIFTVDPTDAKDFDDAISISKDKDGNFNLGVHIADVSAFVLENSSLDKDALERSFSLYLPSSVIPMLPKKLSNLYCSLNPNIDRLALSCFMKIDSEGEIQNYSFKETVLNSKMRFDYKTFQESIDKMEAGEELTGELQNFASEIRYSKELKDILKNKRLKEGSIEFNLPEVKIELDDEGRATRIYNYVSYESCNIIEEFMLAANKSAADFLTKRIEKLPAVYRIHDKPSVEKIGIYLEELNKNKIKIPPTDDITNPFFLKNILKKVKNNPQGDVLIQYFLRSMMKAKYSTDNIGHFGLGFNLYTHFTSPIRRYPDLMVHRLIKKHLKKLSINKKDDNLKSIEEKCKHISIREIKNIKAEYEARDTKIVEFMESKIGKIYTGVINSITPFGAYVLLNEIPIEGMLHLRNQTDDNYSYNEEKRILKGQRTGNELFIGKEVKIKVTSIDHELLNIDFRLEKS